MTDAADRETATLAADAAAAAIRPFFRRADLAVDTKTDASPVTEADRAAEAAMRAVIAARHPADAILGEEGGAAGASGAARCWVLDPIDGTRAFITGRPLFTTLVALVADGAPVLGVINQPVTGERWVGTAAGTTFVDPWGGGGGPRPLPARARPPLARAELSATTPAMFDGTARARFERLAARAGRVSWGGDAYAYGLLAIGGIDVVAEASMQVWDWAALVPVIEGAGGIVTDWAGAKLRAGGDGTVLAAGSRALHEAAVAALAA